MEFTEIAKHFFPVKIDGRVLVHTKILQEVLEPIGVEFTYAPHELRLVYEMKYKGKKLRVQYLRAYMQKDPQEIVATEFAPGGLFSGPIPTKFRQVGGGTSERVRPQEDLDRDCFEAFMLLAEGLGLVRLTDEIKRELRQQNQLKIFEGRYPKHLIVNH